jgi:hypothetical protein
MTIIFKFFNAQKKLIDCDYLYMRACVCVSRRKLLADFLIKIYLLFMGKHHTLAYGVENMPIKYRGLRGVTEMNFITTRS